MTITFWLWAAPILLGIVVASAVVIAGVSAHRTRTAVEAAAVESADAARRAHRTFVTRLDHELKNPVTALRMGLTQVSDANLASSMGAQVERLSSLVTDLRKITEIEDYPIADEPVDLREIVDERLAQLFNATGKPEEALKLLEGDAGSAALELRGDALLASGKRDQARDAYADALAGTDVASPARRRIELKLQEVGGTLPDPAEAG